jgi:hypothetical protein
MRTQSYKMPTRDSTCECVQATAAPSYSTPLRRCSSSTVSAGESVPKSVTTAHEHGTTFVASPSLSILHRPAHWPSCAREFTMMMCTPPSSHRARTRRVYSGFSQSLARQHRRAVPRSSALTHLQKTQNQRKSKKHVRLLM